MGLVVSATPLFAADAGVGEGYIGLVLGANSILVALLALPVAARIEAQRTASLSRRRGAARGGDARLLRRDSGRRRRRCSSGPWCSASPR